MADDINKKISIDVQVNTDAQQQVDQYKTSFDNLRVSINQLGKPISDLSNSVNSLDRDISKFTDSISKLNNQNQSSLSIGEKLKSNVEGLTSSYKTWKEVIAATEVVSEGWVGVLAAGLSVLTQYAPQILDWMNNIGKSNTVLTAYTKALKDYNIIMSAVSNAKQQGLLDAQQELTHLKLLYAATQDHNLSLQKRKTVITELRNEYPAYFKNLSDEQILTGKASNEYNNLANSIIATSRARAAEEIMVKNSKRQIENDNSITKLISQLKTYQKQLATVNSEYSKYASAHREPIGREGVDGTSVDYLTEIDNTKFKIDELQQQISHVNTDTKLLGGQNNALTKDILNGIAKQGTAVVGVTKKALDQQMNYSASAKQKLDNKLSEAEKAQQEAVMKQLQMSNNAYASAALAEDQHYKDEKDKLKQMLDSKLISLLQYNKEAQKIEAEHKENMGAILDKFIKDNSVKTADLQNRLVELQTKSMGANDIEHMLNQVNVVRVDLEQKYQDTITKKAKISAEERADFEVKTMQKTSDAAFSIISKGIQSQSDKKIRALENDKALELSNTSLTSVQKQAIEKNYKKKEDAIKVKAFKDEQKASVAQAIINGAIAITKAEAQTGVLGALVIPGIIAETAIQVASIASQKPPAYAKGGHFHSDGRGAVLSGYSRSDDTNAFLRSGEAVVVSEAMRDPWARNLVSAINVAYGGRDFSVPNLTRGYAVGGIFTDGGNANRYYNQPVNDQKNLANTVAYQMVNNFPPVYVDVKDINNQQNILAQTINRVNL